MSKRLSSLGMRVLPLFLLTAIAAVLIAGCGSSKKTAPANTPIPPSSGGTIVSTASNSLGTILVASNGRTLYIFQPDTPNVSTCYNACAVVWPPLLTKGTPVVRAGIDQSHLGTTKRKDGTSQVTYFGHPLYTYVTDSSAGATTGQAINLNGGLWYVIGSNGTVITTKSSSGGGGGGY
jgi:predicted lipoprotein with Yx(FWY)xxD motif